MNNAYSDSQNDANAEITKSNKSWQSRELASRAWSSSARLDWASRCDSSHDATRCVRHRMHSTPLPGTAAVLLRVQAVLARTCGWKTGIEKVHCLRPTSHLKCLVYHWSSSWPKKMLMLSNFKCFPVLCRSKQSALQAQAVSMPSISPIIECPTAPIAFHIFHVFDSQKTGAKCFQHVPNMTKFQVLGLLPFFPFPYALLDDFPFHLPMKLPWWSSDTHFPPVPRRTS